MIKVINHKRMQSMKLKYDFLTLLFGSNQRKRKPSNVGGLRQRFCYASKFLEVFDSSIIINMQLLCSQRS